MLTAHSAQPQTMDGPRDYDPKKHTGTVQTEGDAS